MHAHYENIIERSSKVLEKLLFDIVVVFNINNVMILYISTIKSQFYVFILSELLKYSACSANFNPWIYPYLTLFKIF